MNLLIRLIKRVQVKMGGGDVICVDNWFRNLRMSQSGHLYAEMHFRPSMYFTRTQLSRVHPQFFHLSAAELFKLIERDLPEYDTMEIRKVMVDKHKMLGRGLRLLLAQKMPGSMNGYSFKYSILRVALNCK